ncbi:lysozyme-like protein [Rhizobium phage RHph_X3_2]|nr:lysozyme-like protein [Rhizobium phage RHph_X3_2]
MDKALFYRSLQQDGVPVFVKRLNQSQIDGMEADIAEAQRRHLSAKEFAAILAEEYHETGGKMQPVLENLNYSVNGLLKTFSRERISAADAKRLGRKPGEATLSEERQRAIANLIYGGDWGRRNLGNTHPNDGWERRGRGKVQITGRTNDRKFGIEDEPSKALEMETSTFILFEGIIRGKFTGKKLSDYVTATRADYRGSRACVNNDVKENGDDIERYALGFEHALTVAGWGGGNASIAPVSDVDSIRAVQQTLFDLGYTEVGPIDGKTGKLTRAAVLAAKHENAFLPLNADITPAFVAALMTFQPRDLGARAEAPAALVRQNAPEVKSNYMAKIIGGVAAGGSTVAGASQLVLEHISPWKNMFADVPSYVWLILSGVVFGVIMMVANNGEKAGTEAYRTGERR